MSKLFRNEAMDHQAQRFHGAILLTRTWSYSALTIFFCGIILALVVFSLFFGFTRKETVNGMVVPDRGLIRLVAPQSGVVTRIRVTEGQEVRAGDALFILSSERASTRGEIQSNINETLASRIAHLRTELEGQQRQTDNKRKELDERLANLRASAQQTENELATQRHHVQLVRDVSSRVAELAKTGNMSQVAANEKAADVTEQESKLAEMELERLVLQREIAALEASRVDLPLQAGRDASQLLRSIEELKQQVSENDVKREVVVCADRAGRIAGIIVDPGQAVVSDQHIASLLPVGSVLEAELYAPTRAAGFIHAGTQVLIRYDAYPYQKFGQFHGRVREISLNTIPLGELQLSGAAGLNQISKLPSSPSEPVYRIRVQLESQDIVALGQAHALKPGMQLVATLLLEHRTIAEWVLEPLFGMTAQL